MHLISLPATDLESSVEPLLLCVSSSLINHLVVLSKEKTPCQYSGHIFHPLKTLPQNSSQTTLSTP